MKKTSELTVYGISCRHVTIFYRQQPASLFQAQEKLRSCKNSKLNFLSSYFIIDDSRAIIIWLHVVVFSKHDILRF